MKITAGTVNLPVTARERVLLRDLRLRIGASSLQNFLRLSIVHYARFQKFDLKSGEFAQREDPDAD